MGNNITTPEEVILNSVNMANLAINSPENVKMDLLHKYELLASSKSGVNLNTILDNAYNYSVIFNKTLFITLINTRKPMDLISYKNLNNELLAAIKENDNERNIGAVKKLYTRLNKVLKDNNIEVCQMITPTELQTAIQTFGVAQAKPEEIEELPYEIEPDPDLDNLIDESEFDEDIEPENEEIILEDDEPILNEEDITEGDGSYFDTDSNIQLEDDEIILEDDEPILDEDEKEEKRKKQLKSGKVSGTADDIENDTSEADEEIKALVNNAINNIMNHCTRIYQPLFNNPPKGVMYTDANGKINIMAVGNGETHTGVKIHNIPSIRLFVVPMYNAIKNISGDLLREAPKVGDDGMDIKTSWMNPDGTMKYNYAPHIQVRNCMGVYKDKKTGRLNRAKTWSEFKGKLSSEWRPTITSLLKRVDLNNDAAIKRAMTSIQELYTTIFLVNEFDVEKAFRLTISCQSLSSSGIINKLTEAIVNSNPLNKDLSEYQIMNSSTDNGILQALVVTDADKYRGEINFAYKTLGKIILSGGSIDISHTIVGTDLSGNPVELNLANNAYVSMGIVAGTRSGKGVLTMSLLASMIAAKCPVVYLDYKPDMAGTFWKLERKYGAPTLAIDGQTSKLPGLTPVRNYQAGYGVPSKLVDEINDKLNVIPYIKGVQLMNLIGAARVAGKLSKKYKMFFVLDEAQQCSKQIYDNGKEIELIRDKNKPKGKGAEESPEYKYLVKLSKLFSSVGQSATTFLNTNGGLGNMGALILGQQANAGEWKGPLGPLMLKCAIKFLGNGTVGGSQYGLNSKIKGVGMIGTGYFGLSTSNTPTDDNTKIIKSTLVLNDGDFDVETMTGGDYTGSLLNNITNEAIKADVIENDMVVSESNDIAISAGLQVGEANPLVGFPGLIEFIGNNSGDFNIQEALSAGYREVENILHLLGIVGTKEDGYPYQNVEAYMYSAREDSLFTSGQLNNALNNDMTIYDYIENGASENENGLISDESEDREVDEEEYSDDIINMGASSNTESVVDETSDKTYNNSQQNEVMTDDEAFAGMGSGRSNFEEPRRKINVPKFTYASTLARMNLDKSILEAYLKKYCIEQRLIKNQFIYNDRTDVTKGNNLKMAVVTASNYIYLTDRLGLGRQDVISNAFQQINNNNNNDYRYSFLLGMIQALDSGELPYDTMPTEDQMRTWANQFIAVQQSGNSPINSFETTENTRDTGETIAERVLRLSMTVCANRNWTAEQLLDFQNALLQKMGVQ